LLSEDERNNGIDAKTIFLYFTAKKTICNYLSVDNVVMLSISEPAYDKTSVL